MKLSLLATTAILSTAAILSACSKSETVSPPPSAPRAAAEEPKEAPREAVYNPDLKPAEIVWDSPEKKKRWEALQAERAAR